MGKNRNKGTLVQFWINTDTHNLFVEYLESENKSLVLRTYINDFIKKKEEKRSL